MSIRVEHKSTVIVMMIMWAQSWCAIVSPPGGEGSRMKGVYGRAVRCREGHMRTSGHRSASTNPEERFLVRTVS